MVRNLYLNYLFKKEATRVVPESESVCLAAALASAESRKGHSARIVGLSSVSFPLWIVQTSPTKSIALNASSSGTTEFHFTEMRGASEVKRIISSDLSQATDIPNVASKMQPLLENVDHHTASVAGLADPSFIKAIGHFVLVSGPATEPNRVDIRSDSNVALKRSEEFKKISESAKLRIESAETLQRLIRENYGGQTTILENITNLERERGNERVRMMEERTKQELAKLTENKENKIYELREKHTMNLRAMTADFSRALNDLEQFFAGLVGETREAITQIGQKEADTQGAVSVYNSLVSSLRETLANLQHPFDMMDEKKSDLERRVAEAQARFESDKVEAENQLKAEIEERQRRIDAARNETGLKAKELDDLKAEVNAAIGKSEQAIENRVLEFQQEFLNLMNWTLDNDSIRELAPLTLFDMHTYVVRYDDGSHRVLTPCFLPEGSLLTMEGEPLSKEFDDAFTASIDNLLQRDQSFKESFQRACTRGNMLLAAEAEELLVQGLEELLRRGLLQRDEIERLVTVWSRYSGKCPKCGASVEAGAQFCQKCGVTLAG
ncbi:MAG: zinc-ribbon domain-containing protein [Promethearchaeota archaeon]